MNKNIKYLLLIVGLLGLLLVMELVLPKPIRWDKTLSSDDKIPYGTFVFRESLQAGREAFDLRRNRASFYEIPDSIKQDVLVISREFVPQREDVNALMAFVNAGNNVIVASEFLGGVLGDTLHFHSEDILQSDFERTGNPFSQDSSFIKWNSNKYYYAHEDNGTVFDEVDSTWTVLATHENGSAVIISRNIGAGRLILSNNPWIFSNYYILEGKTGIINQLLSHVSPQLLWTEFYARGRTEPQTPLRYILSVPSLAWAYYVLIGGVIVLVIFETKRRQRPIPVIEPPTNDSLEFSNTLGNLYYENGNHKKIARRMIDFLLEQIRERYYMTTNTIDDAFVKGLARKSGKPEVNINGLFVLIGIIESKKQIDEGELRDLNKKIDTFLIGENGSI